MKKRFACAVLALALLLAALPAPALADSPALKDFKVTSGKRVSVDLDGDGKKDSVSYKTNENADGYIKITLTKSKKTWKYSLAADDFYRNPDRTLYNKLRTVVFKNASGNLVFAFMTCAVGNGGDEDAFDLVVFVLKNGKLVRQKLTPPAFSGNFSADGSSFSVVGADTGFSGRFYTNPELGAKFANLTVWSDMLTDLQCVESASGGCDLVLGMKLYSESRANALGTAYTLYQVDGGGKLKAVQQEFVPDSSGTDPGLIVEQPSAQATTALLNGLIASDTVSLIGMTFTQISEKFAAPVSYTLMTDWQPYFTYSSKKLNVEQAYFSNNYYPDDAYDKDSVTYKVSAILPYLNKNARCIGAMNQVSVAMCKLITQFIPDTSITGKLVDDEEFGYCYRFTYKGFKWLITSPTGGYIASISDVYVTKAN